MFTLFRRTKRIRRGLKVYAQPGNHPLLLSKFNLDNSERDEELEPGENHASSVSSSQNRSFALGFKMASYLATWFKYIWGRKQVVKHCCISAWPVVGFCFGLFLLLVVLQDKHCEWDAGVQLVFGLAFCSLHGVATWWCDLRRAVVTGRFGRCRDVVKRRTTSNCYAPPGLTS